MTNSALSQLTADMRRFLDSGARQATQAHDRLWYAFFEGYQPGIPAVSVPYMKDLYPFFGDGIALHQKLWDAVFLLESSPSGPSDAMREFLAIVAQHRHNDVDLEFVPAVLGLDLPDLETDTYHFTYSQQQAWRRLGEFMDFLAHMSRRLRNSRYRMRQEELTAMNDGYHHQIFKALGTYLCLARG